MYEVSVDSAGSSKRLKSGLTLDFTSQVLRRPRQDLGILSTPDVAPGMLKLASPELERLILQHSGTSSVCTPTTQVLFPTSVTEDQERYARGFVDALLELHAASQLATAAGIHKLGTASSGFKSEEADEGCKENSARINSSVVGVVGYLNNDDEVVEFSTKPKSLPIEMLSHCTETRNIDCMQTISNHSAEFDVNGNVNSTKRGVKRPYQDLEGSPTIESPLSVGPPVLPTPSPLSVGPPVPPTPTSIVSSSTSSLPAAFFPPGIEPIDMAQQERIKLDRKRARNRVAATRCRERKLERIACLEEQVAQLKGSNAELVELAAALRESVCQMKMEIVCHVNEGCRLMMHGALI